MGMLGWLFGFIGGGCMLMGVLTALDQVPLLSDELTWTFWFILSALLLLMSIAFAVGSSNKVGQ